MEGALQDELRQHRYEPALGGLRKESPRQWDEACSRSILVGRATGRWTIHGKVDRLRTVLTLGLP